MVVKGKSGQVWSIDDLGNQRWNDPTSLPELKKIHAATGRATAELRGINEMLQIALADMGLESSNDVVANTQKVVTQIKILTTAVNNIAKVLQERGILK